MHRYESTDEQWALIEKHLPANGRRGGQWKDHRPVVDGILWILHGGAPWRDLPERYGSFQTAHRRFLGWRRDGTWERILAGLRGVADDRGLIDWDRWNADATSVRATRHAAGARKGGSMPDEPQDHALGRSHGGFGSKLHVLTDGAGNFLQVVVTRGNRNECPVLGPLLGSAAANLGRRPSKLVGDKGYSSDAIRDGLVRCRIRPVIPMRDTEHLNDRDRWGRFDKKTYRKRNVVERAIAKLKEFRRIATRYEKLAEAYIGMVGVGVIVLYLRLLS